jgi:hypothetical protein
VSRRRMSAREPAGECRGALGGMYPATSIGLPPTAGAGIYDEFVRPPHAGKLGGWEIGDLLWDGLDISGAITPSAVVPTAATEVGICRLTTTATAGEGGAISHDYNAWQSPIAIGCTFAVKILGHEESVCWSGWIEDPQLVPNAAVVNDFVGVRYDTDVDDNWYGVVRSGAAETTVSLGVSRAAWRIMGFQRLCDTSFQFGTWQCGNARRGPLFVPVGAAIALPAGIGNLGPTPLGVVNRDYAATEVDIDFWATGGPVARE